MPDPNYDIIANQGFIGIGITDTDQMLAEYCDAALDREGMPLPLKKLRLAQWLAIPRAYRSGQTMDNLAGMLKVPIQELRQWKYRDDVQFVVQKLTKLYFIDFIPDVVEALRARSLMGDPNAAKIFLAFVEAIKEDEDDGKLKPKKKLSRENIKERIDQIRQKRLSPPPDDSE